MLKLVIFYNQFKQGFSETYYIDTGFSPQAFVDSITNSVLNNLVGFRSNTTSLYALRASSVTGARVSGLRVLASSYKGNTLPVNWQSGPDIVSTDAVLRLNSASGKSRRVWLRGLPDDLVIRDSIGDDAPPALLTSAMKKYLAALVAIGAQIRTTQYPPDGGLIWTTVMNVQVTAGNPGLAQVTLAGGVTPAGFVDGAYVVFQGTNGTQLPHFPRVNRLVLTPVAGLAHVAYKVPDGLTVFTRKLRVTLLNYQYAAISDFQFERFGEHKTGKPFGQLRGRSRAVARAF